MAAAATQSSRLNASAPPFVLRMPLVPPPVSPELYTGPLPAALPPAGFYYPPPVLVAPPPPYFQPGAFVSWSAFPQPQGPCVGMPTSGWAPVTPMAAVGLPASPAAVAPSAPDPQLPGITATTQGCRRRHGRQHFAARRLPRLDLPPRMQRAAGLAAAAHSSSPAGAKGESAAKEASPRSVLVQMRASPPDTPPALPPSFPYPELGSPSPPASAGSPSSVSVPAGGSQAVAAAPRRRRGERAPPARPSRRAAGAGGTARNSEPKPRRIFDPSSCNTSLMIRNLPNDFRRTRLMQIIDQHCCLENEKVTSGGIKSEFDFLYLPMDFRTGANKGYAFVNLTTPEAARRLHDHLHGHRWKVNGSGKTCEVDQADVEGLDDLVKNFSQSRFDCGDEEFLPVWFEPPRDGSRRTLPHLVGRMLRCW
ncbi:unnamed protein product [Urochloa decumbens]|uniref:RRM domain-containing protein n=1 Tax=Urochloa decumbens TaxID=240449 RepID=A0ABC9EVU7_9POAL